MSELRLTVTMYNVFRFLFVFFDKNNVNIKYKLDSIYTCISVTAK